MVGEDWEKEEPTKGGQRKREMLECATYPVIAILMESFSKAGYCSL